MRSWNVVRILAVGLVVVPHGNATQLTEATSKDNSNDCECYIVSGDDAGYFQYYRFWDFRDIVADGSNDYSVAPPLVTTAENDGGQNITSGFFNTTQFNNDWSLQDGDESPHDGSALSMVNSYQNIFISRDSSSGSTYLALRAFKLPDFVSIAEIDSNQKNVLHASIRTRMRVIPDFSGSSNAFADVGNVIDGANTSHPVAPGAVVGVFTYQSDKQESDIEILTYDPTTNIRYSNQPDFDEKTGNTVPGASTDQVLPNDDVWTDYHDHRLDWFDGMTRWYVDGDLALEKTINVPTKPSGLVLNVWSDGGEWSGNMSIGAQVVAGFEWIEMAFNISGKVTGPHKRHGDKVCNVGCNIDNITEIGYPQVAFNATGSDNGAKGMRSMPTEAAAWWTVAVVCFMLLT